MTYEEIVDFTKKKMEKLDSKKFDESVAVQVDIYGEGEGAFYIKLENKMIEVAPYEYHDRDLKIIATEEQYLAVIDLKVDVKEVVAEGNDTGIQVFDDLLHSAKKVTKKAPAKVKAPAKDKSPAKAKVSAKTKDTVKKEEVAKVPAKKVAVATVKKAISKTAK